MTISTKEGSELLYLSRGDVERLGVSMMEVIDVVEAAFREKGAGRVEMPPKPGLHTRPDAFIHAMPAYLPGLGAAGIKWVSGYPNNHLRGLPYISGLIIVNSPESGLPLAVMDCTWITAVRTGAVSAVAARYLVRQESRALAILGCGVQGRTQLVALLIACPGVAEIRVYDIHPAALDAYLAEMAPRYAGRRFVRAGTPREAVEGADLIVTAGPILKRPEPIVEAGWFGPGALALPIDFDSMWQAAALRSADKYFVDDLAQYEYYRSEGYFADAPAAEGDLGEVVVGVRARRETQDQRIVSMNLGLALEDVATANLVYHRALAADVGMVLRL